MRRTRRRSAVSPKGAKVGPLRSTTLLRGIRSACSGEESPLLCPKPNVMPRFSLGDVGEAPWLLSHRWIDTSPILQDAAHDSRMQGRVVSHSALKLLTACVRLRQLRQVHHSLQQALSPCSRTQSSATDGSPACCTCLMLHLCVMFRVPSRYSVRSLLVLLLCKQGCSSYCLARSCLGHYIGSCRGVRPRTNARGVVDQ